jgi:hypothetical protein
MAEKRWRKTQQAVANAIMDEIGANMPNPATTPRDAYAYIVAKQAVTLLDEQHPRMDDVEKLGQIMGEVPRASELRAVADQVQPRTQPEVVLALLAMIDTSNISTSDDSAQHSDTDSEYIDGRLMDTDTDGQTGDDE